MTPALIGVLAFWLVIAIALGLFSWRIWRHGQMRFAAFTSSAQPWDHMDPGVQKHTQGPPM